MANIVYIATSIDGFIAKKDGNIDWLNEIPNPNNDDFGFNDFMKRVDALVMGRNTFEKVLEFGKWPYIKPVFVLSNVLKETPNSFKGDVRFIKGTPNEIVQLLNSKGFKNLYIDGGVTVQKFLEAELIDEMIITRIPILLGDGILLFGGLDKPQKFEHYKTDLFNNTLVKSYYRRIK